MHNYYLFVICLFYNYTAPPEIYTDCHTRSLLDCLPISAASVGANSTTATDGSPSGQPRSACRAWVRTRVTSPFSARYARRASGKRSEEHTSELQPLLRSTYAVFCL